MKRTVKLRVVVHNDRICYVVADHDKVQEFIPLIRPDKLDHIRHDTEYAKTVEGAFTFDDGKKHPAAKPRARRR